MAYKHTFLIQLAICVTIILALSLTILCKTPESGTQEKTQDTGVSSVPETTDAYTSVPETTDAATSVPETTDAATSVPETTDAAVSKPPKEKSKKFLFFNCAASVPDTVD